MGKLTRNKEKIYTRIYIHLEPFALLVFEPILFAFGIYIIFERIRSIIEFTSTNPQYDLYQIINKDMEMNPLPYIGFFLMLFLWWGWKVVQHNYEVIQQKRLIQTLYDIKKGIKDTEKEIKKLRNNKIKTENKGN